jgi:hypothetical protein
MGGARCFRRRGERLEPSGWFSQSDFQIAQGFQNVSALRFKHADRFPQPATILAPIGRAKFAGDLLGGGEHVIEVAGVDLLMDTLSPLLVSSVLSILRRDIFARRSRKPLSSQKTNMLAMRFTALKLNSLRDLFV